MKNKRTERTSNASHAAAERNAEAVVHDQLIELGFVFEKLPEATAAVAAFQNAEGLPATGVADAATVRAVSAALAASTVTVSGQVNSPNVTSVAGLEIVLLNRGVGEDRSLASTRTDADGCFRFNRMVLSARVLGRPAGTRPDLLVQVSGTAGLLAKSAVQYNAPAKVTFKVELPADAPGLPSEYEALTSAVSAVYAGPLASLQETPEQADLTYLANKTGWDARAVALAALAAQLSQKTRATAATPPGKLALSETPAIQPEFFYALLRSGLVSDPAQCLHASPTDVEAAWKQALTDNVISASLSAQLPAALSAFERLAAPSQLADSAPGAVSTLKEMLVVTLPEPAQQQQFAALYMQYPQAGEPFWSAVSQAFGEEKAAELKLTGSLLSLTRNNAPLVAALLQADPTSSLTSTRDLVSRGLYEPFRWQPLISQALGSVPPGTAGEDADEQAANYAATLATQLRVQFPTDVLADQVKRGFLAITGSAETVAAVYSFLSTNSDDFMLGAEPVEAYLRRKAITDTPDTVINEIKRLHRVYQLTPDDSSMATLLRQGLDSASAIVRYKPLAFTRTFGGKLGGDDKAALIHARASHVYSSVLNTTVTYLAARALPSLGVASIIDPLQRAQPVTSTSAPASVASAEAAHQDAIATDASATLEGLFGSMDYCGCGDCNSILSPAAYMVDLLSFLDIPEPVQGFSNPQDVLLARRPDLQYLPLTCENTNTALPYLDLVNETLEYFVANNLSLANYQGHDTAEGVLSEDLLASPQFLNAAAYAATESIYFPAPLPFDRSLELLRLQLSSMGVNLPDLMIALRPNDQIVNNGTPLSYGWSEILCEQLQISYDELALFTGPDVDLGGLGGLYGLPADGTALGTLRSMNVQQFTRRMGISYDDLIAILQTRWVNPDASLIPLLEHLQMPIANLVALYNGTLTAVQFIQLLPSGLDATKYGGAYAGDLAAIPVWAVGPATGGRVPVYPRLLDIITIADPGDVDACSGTSLFLRYINPDPTSNLLTETDYTRLLHFIRLWQKVASLFGTVDHPTSIQQTAAIFDTIYPSADLPQGTGDPANDDTNIELMASGLALMLPRLSFLVRVMNQLGLTPENSLSQLLACWGNIETVGQDNLYQELFLTPALQQQDQMGQTATVSGFFNPGEVLSTVISGLMIPYTVALGDEAAGIATNITAAINSCKQVDVLTGLEINQRFFAFANGGVITVRVGFMLLCSTAGVAGAAATETLKPTTGATQTPLSQQVTLAGTLTPGDMLTLLINQTAISTTVMDGDTTASIMKRLADSIGSTTAQDAYSGVPLNTVVIAGSSGDNLTLLGANVGTPFDFECTLSSPTSNGYTVAPLDPGGIVTLTLSAGANPGDTFAVVFTPNYLAAATTYTYPASAADSDVSVLAANIALVLAPATWLAGNVTAVGGAVTFTLLDWQTVSVTTSSVVATFISSGPTPRSVSATLVGPVPPLAVVNTVVDEIVYAYPVTLTDTTETIVANIATMVNAKPPGTNLAASSTGDVLKIYFPLAGYPFPLTVSGNVSLVGAYVLGPHTPACWRCSLSNNALVARGAQVTTTIDGCAVPHWLSGNDLSWGWGPGLVDLSASINGSLAMDPVTGLPLGQMVYAYPAPDTPWTSILVAAVDGRTNFSVACSYLPAANGVAYTYTVGGPTNATQTVTVVEPIAPGAQLTTTINGADVVYTVTPFDTAMTIAYNIASAIYNTDAIDATTGEPISSLFNAIASGNGITITANSFTTPLTLSLTVSSGSYTAGRQETPFADDGYGNLLGDPTQTIMGYEPLLCAACNLTGTEFGLITGAGNADNTPGLSLNFDASTPLTLENVSSIFRFGWLPHTLGMSVLEFLQLRVCTQLDPFLTLDGDYWPSVQQPAVIPFLRLVESLETAGLKPVQVLYLIWNNDITGEAAPKSADIDALAFALRQDFFVVNTQFALASDPDGSIARGLMTLVYGETSTDFFFGLLNNTITLTVPYAAPPQLGALPAAVESLSNGLLLYDDLRKQLSFIGLLAAGTATTLENAPGLIHTTDSTVQATAGPATVFTPASMDGIESGSSLWVDSGALKELVVVSATTATTFTAATQQPHDGTVTPLPLVDSLIVAIAALADRSAALTAPFFQTYPELQPLYAAYAASTDDVQNKRNTLLGNFLPTLRNKRKQEQALARISSAANTNSSLATLLINGASVLHADQDPTSAAIVDLTAIETGGLFASPVNGGLGTQWSGAIDVPQDGLFDFSLAVADGVAVSFLLAGEPVSGVQTDGLWTSETPVSLISGQLSQVQLTVATPMTSLVLNWQTTGTGWQAVSDSYLYPGNLLSNLRGTCVRFFKVATLAGALSLTAAEMAALGSAATPAVLTESSTVLLDAGMGTITPASMAGILPGAVLVLDQQDFQEIVTITAITATTFSAVLARTHDGSATPFRIRSLTLVGGTLPETQSGWMNLLGPTVQLTTALQAALRDILQDLLDFARMKATLSPADERLINVLLNPAATLDNGQTALVSVTGWAVPSINALLTHFYNTIQPVSLGSVATFRRVFDAYALVNQCRVTAATLISTITSYPTANTVSSLQSALRALYAESDWQSIIRPINDTMRMKQRDALVAYILQQPFAAQNGLSTANDLFAWFLLDTETQPPVQTSRIRMALSAIQLFTERCVRNLEPNVATSDIDAQQWSWMKRYRVWQANREIFLWPENWLYPELRDDASPLFTSTTGRLLQSDINNDEAANAYLDYLTGLEEVAKLEPCGFFYVEATPSTDEVSYVVARTAGAKRKYFFRQQQGGSWTPWTEVPIECEGLPLTPVLWSNRLFLVWLKAVKQTAPQFVAAPAGDPTMDQIHMSQTQTSASNAASLQNNSVAVSGMLCYSEFYNNKWQPTKTSDPDRPTSIGTYAANGPNSFEFARELLAIIPGVYAQSAATLHVTEDLSQALILRIGNTYNGYFYPVPASLQAGSGFVLHNSHSRPIRFEDISYLPSTTGTGQPIQNLLDTPFYCRDFNTASDYTGRAASGTLSLDMLQANSVTANTGWTASSYNNVLQYRWAPCFIQAPPPPQSTSAWSAPFLYEDRKNVFYVTVATTTTVSGSVRLPPFGISWLPPQTSVHKPGLTVFQTPTAGNSPPFSNLEATRPWTVNYGGVTIATTGAVFPAIKNLLK
jgi:hypothetical protein